MKADIQSALQYLGSCLGAFAAGSVLGGIVCLSHQAWHVSIVEGVITLLLAPIIYLFGILSTFWILPPVFMAVFLVGMVGFLGGTGAYFKAKKKRGWAAGVAASILLGFPNVVLYEAAMSV